MLGSGENPDLQLHQTLGGKADHLAQQVGVGALLQKPTKGHPLLGHRVGAPVRVVPHNPTLPENHR
jgi:hypothetical protein